MAAQLDKRFTELLHTLRLECQRPDLPSDHLQVLREMQKVLEQCSSEIFAPCEPEKLEIARLEGIRQDLVKSRNILRSLFDNLPDLVYVIDRNYEIIAVNMALSRKKKISPKALVGNTCYKNLHQLEASCPDCRIAHTLRTGEVITRIHWERGADRETNEWEITTYPIYDDRGEVTQIIAVERDVTERHRMEMMVAQSEKMAAVGQLAAGFAHEINNPLTVVIANAQILMREIPTEDDWHDLLQRINVAGGRALEIVKNLLDFARWESMELEPTDVNATIEKALALIDHVSKGIQASITFDPQAGLPILPASARNLQSVWVNLILNSLDAIDPGTGRVEIRTGLDRNDIVVRISDNGQGISKDQLSKIFDPFFTTKDPGKGTGLGLSICHRIIKQHDGVIDVDSMPGEGTVFTVRLPVETI